jgi:hypothetical protein
MAGAELGRSGTLAESDVVDENFRLILIGFPFPGSALIPSLCWRTPSGRTRGGCQAVSAGGILSGGSGWVRSDLWDIQATIPEGPVEW